jgi:hypothetical protein
MTGGIRVPRQISDPVFGNLIAKKIVCCVAAVSAPGSAALALRRRRAFETSNYASLAYGIIGSTAHNAALRFLLAAT